VVLAAVHGAGEAGAEVARTHLVPLLHGQSRHLREHAAWSLGSAPPVGPALEPLRALVAEGGFAGTLAAATLEAWGEPPADDERGEVDVVVPRLDGVDDAADPEHPPGLTVAQLYLHAEIDGTLRHAGHADTGGIATLLVQLGDALVSRREVARVLTLSRAAEDADPAPSPAELGRPGHHYLDIELPRPPLPATQSWPLRARAREEIRRLLRRAGRVDVLHLRMADVGSWAAAQVARELGVPVVLTLAPDPHALIASREAAGSLTRAGFPAADLQEHLVFRIRLLRALREQAEALVVFPRADLVRDLRTLLHVDPDDPSSRVHVVAEGIDVDALAATGREVESALAGGPVSAAVAAALAELDAVLAALPPERRRLPLVLSAGRLHRVKGMATLVRAWAGHPRLPQACNLLVVGGDLRRPTPDEAGELALIDDLVPRKDGPPQGLLLAGHRPHATVAAWMAAARLGRPGLSEPGGVYACASLKEEFGIALCEALGSGLVVVAPDAGGPPTFVEDRVTGVLVDTTDDVALARALSTALAMASAPDAAARAARARSLVRERFSIENMAAALAPVYGEVARHVPGVLR
jgi:glycosyltransferase involved in cell wall biosynthesis